MTFELTVLGSSSALPTSSKFCSAHVLNAHGRFFLIDCGEGTQMQLRRAKIKFEKINHIFISHLHGDHIFGLMGLLSSFSLLGRKAPLHIYGHSDLRQIIDFYLEYFSVTDSYSIDIHPIVKRTKQLVYDDKLVTVHAFPLKHRVPAFGYLFREKDRPLNIRKECIEKYNLSLKQINEIKLGANLMTGKGAEIPNKELTESPFRLRSYAYCSDTAVYEKIASWVEGVDLLYHESTFLDKDRALAKQTGHSTALQAASIAKKSKAKKLLLGHFSLRYKNTEHFLSEAKGIFPETILAEDLMKYALPLSR